MSSISPPRPPPIKYNAPLGTRWAKEKAAAGGSAAFDLPTDPKTIGPWILGECVGKGASGRVKIAKHRRTGQLAAVKILPVAPLVNSRASLAAQQAKSEKQRLGIDREITMMKLMNHPNIMRIYDVYEGDKELFLVLEYVEGGELFDFLVNRGRLPPNEALIYFRQIVYGLNYAHTFSIIHRDLKPENILIASLSPPQIKIADWGMAAFAPPSLQLETSCGSPHYASPEIVNGEKYQGNATDIWSCGVILYALLTGRLPFDDKNVRTLLSKVKSGKYEMPTWIDPMARDLLSKMLIVDVKQRITIPEILNHPWLLSHLSIPFTALDGSTFTVMAPPMPPSPSILARPLPSADVIDDELFSSLRIIWGRHADPEGDSIKRDLCSPAGRGVHAKAFYFLLGKYREESCRSRSEDDETETQVAKACSSVALEATKFNLDWELEHSGDGLEKYSMQTSRNISIASPAGSLAAITTVNLPPSTTNLAQASCTAVASVTQNAGVPITSRKRTFTDGDFPTNMRSASSGFPERRGAPHYVPITTPLTSEKSRSQVNLVTTSTTTSRTAPLTPNATSALGTNGGTARAKSPTTGLGRGIPHPFPQRRGYTFSATTNVSNTTPTSGDTGSTSADPPSSALGFSHHLQQLQVRAASASAASSFSNNPYTRGHRHGQRSKSSAVGPISPFVDVENLKKPMTVVSPLAALNQKSRSHSNSHGQSSSATGSAIDASGALGAQTRECQPLSPIISSTGTTIVHGSVEVDNIPLLTAPKVENAALQRTMDDITQKVNNMVQAVTQTPANANIISNNENHYIHNLGLSNKENNHVHVQIKGATSTIGHHHNYQKNVENRDEDKENQSIDEEWSHVSIETDRSGCHGLGVGVAIGSREQQHDQLQHREVGRDLVNAGPVIVSPDKATAIMKKEKERKSRPPPLDLPPLHLHPKRSTLAMLGSPIALASPVHPPSSAGRILASPVVGEFKGWFSNLFNWKQSNGQDGLIYSNDDIHRTRSNVMRLLGNLGILLSNTSGGSYHPDPDVLYCRIEHPIMDHISGISLKSVRFRAEFKAASTGTCGTDASSALTPTPDDNGHSLPTPTPCSYQITTPTQINSNIPQRPRASILLGRTASNGTPLPSPLAHAKFELPVGCQCVIALIHEKGSVSTFRTVWKKLKEDYGDVGTAYSCFSPSMPTTPYPENQRMVIN